MSIIDTDLASLAETSTCTQQPPALCLYGCGCVCVVGVHEILECALAPACPLLSFPEAMGDGEHAPTCRHRGK